MSRIYSILGIAATLMFCSGKAQVSVAVINAITLQTNSLRTGEKLLKVCYNHIESEPAGIKSKTLDIAVKASGSNDFTIIPVREFTTGITPVDDCGFFEADITAHAGKEVWFIMEGRDMSDTPLIHGEAIFDLPAEFITEDSIKAQMVGERNDNPTTPDSLRLETSSKGWQVCDTKKAPAQQVVTLHCTEEVNFTPPCYAIEIGIGGSYSLCIPEKEVEKNPGPAKLYSAAITPDTSSKETIVPEDEIKLTYGEPASTITFTMTTTITEFVAYNDKATPYPIATNPSTGCTIDSYDKTKKTINIIIVKVVGDTVTSNIIPFEDYGINGAYLGDKIFEIYWKRSADDENTFFEATISVEDDLKETVVVDCSFVDIDHPTDDVSCFGYFINLDFSIITGTSFLINVAPTILLNGNSNPVKNNQIVNTIIHTKVRSTSILDITLVQKPSYSEGILQVCYKAYGSKHNNSRHESIIFDEDGHWMKIYRPTEEENVMHCFPPVNFLMSSMRIAKDTKITAVVLERGPKGNKVLASGQKDIDLSTFRIIKPEVDDGSKGSSSTLAIVGAAVAGIACLVALVAAAVMFVMKIQRDNDGLQYPLHRTDIEDSNIVHGLENPIPTM